MANKHRGEVEVRLGGRTWTMRPAFQALAEIEGTTGLGFAAVVKPFADSQFGWQRKSGAEIPRGTPLSGSASSVSASIASPSWTGCAC